MTREEAIAKVAKAAQADPEANGNQTEAAVKLWARGHVVALESLGLIKIEEPEQLLYSLSGALMKYLYTINHVNGDVCVVTTKSVIDALTNQGYEVRRKPTQ